MLLALLFACTDAPFYVPDGAFVLDGATDGSGELLDAEDIGAVTLTIDTAGGAATLVVSDGDLVETAELTLAAREEADWRHDCATNYTSAPMETFDLGLDLEVGPLTLPDAILSVDCGGLPMLAAWVDEHDEEPRIRFAEE